MNFANKLKELAVKLELSNNSVFGYPVDKQKQYIAHFPEPKDDFQRSYFQYKCQMRLNKPLVSFLLNIASLPLLIFLFFKCGSRQNCPQKDSVFFSDGKPENIIPDVLRKDAGEIEVVNEKKGSLSNDDKKFIIRLWLKYPFSFQFIAKCLLKIQYYSYEIQKSHPKNIVVCNEYSFTSSILTKYCEEQGVKHINVMHGEKLYYMRDSFFRFHECYVWDEHYKNLFVQMRAEPTQFVIAVPPSLKFADEKSNFKTIDFTYYLGAERGLKLRTIVEAMERMRRSGKKVAIRPHPRYTDLNEIVKVASEIELEDCKKMTIEQSLRRTANAVSVYSTVLNQAYNNRIGIVIDDVSDKEKFNLLSERLYVMLKKPHKLLSQMLEACA